MVTSAVLCFIASLPSAQAVGTLSLGRAAFETIDETDDAIELRSADLPGTNFAAYQVLVTTDASFLALAAAAWDAVPVPTARKFDSQRVVLDESRDSRTVWSLLSLPLVSPRTALVRWERFKLDGSAYVSFYAVPGADPTPANGAIRIGALKGYWKLTPAPRGKTTVEYVTFSNPGGSIPAVFAAPTQRATAIAIVRETLARARQKVIARP